MTVGLIKPRAILSLFQTIEVDRTKGGSIMPRGDKSASSKKGSSERQIDQKLIVSLKTNEDLARYVPVFPV